MNLANKTVLLTGATGGIGRELALLLAQEWSDLILVSRSNKNLRSLSSSIPGKHRLVAADLTSKFSRLRLIKKLRKTKIDILINCAGVGIYKPLPKITDQDWYSSYELNVHTPFFLARDLHPALTVNIGSCSSIQYKKERSLYNSTKAALRSLSLCLEKEVPGKFIHFTLDSTLTNFGPLSIADKQKLQVNGMVYLSPIWVAKEIVGILKSDDRDTEYVLSPHCYESCGTWQKP